jgi:SAM-dependent methyltransferase
LADNTWEDQIARNPSSDLMGGVVGIAQDFKDEEISRPFAEFDITEALTLDTKPIPETKAREGYYGPKHLSYWISGLKDSTTTLKFYQDAHGEMPKNYLDFGGATGRVARHMRYQHGIEDVTIADLNREHVNWVVEHFDGDVKAFQGHSVPSLPLEDNSLDMITAFSVFSHIETFDETWLLELRRILRPGGKLIITAHLDMFQDIKETWPVYKPLTNHPDFDMSWLGKPLENDRLVQRWRSEISYSSNVFLRREYVEKRWKPFFASMEIIPYLTQFQTGVVFTK